MLPNEFHYLRNATEIIIKKKQIVAEPLSALEAPLTAVSLLSNQEKIFSMPLEITITRSDNSYSRAMNALDRSDTQRFLDPGDWGGGSLRSS